MTSSSRAVADPLDHGSLYRMPWSLTDNAMSWLEITTRCNITCIGCYRDPRKDGHKSLEEIREELETFKKLRKSEGMSLAGGDPLVHPRVVEIVKMVREMGWKPLINTNGMALTPELLKQLKEAGAASFTFHIDTTQKRSDFTSETEEGYNVLRKKFADMVAAEGGMTCGYNITVSRKTIHEVPLLVRWAEENADRVHSIHFITYRDFGCAPGFDLYAHGQRVAMEEKRTHPEMTDPTPLKTPEVVDQIRAINSTFNLAAYLSGSCDPKSMKWAFATRLIMKGKTLGYVGPRFMEWTQKLNHMFKGTWLAVPSPRMLAAARTVLFLFWWLDKGVRKALWSYLKAVLRNPLNLFRRVRSQTILLLQPIDILADGRMNMCDGCPDITVHQGALYWSCRLEEIKEYGTFLTASPKTRSLPVYRRKFFHEEKDSA
ncbi:MAG: radical SAM protein [Deltaproteobacteria bacterium]|nr:radical SAM protein [Deltaproteobacteria bacterium]